MTCVFPVQHGAQPVIFDKQEVTGSIPVRPTSTAKAQVTGPCLARATTPPFPVVVGRCCLGRPRIRSREPVFATVVQNNTPPLMLGRVFGALTVLAQAGIPLGAVIAGFVIEVVGIVRTIVVMGAIYTAFTLANFLRPSLRRMDVATTRAESRQTAGSGVN